MDKNKTSRDKKKNWKLMVNFSKKKIIATDAHRGSDKFRDLLGLGYECVGVIKSDDPNLSVFIEDSFFNPEHKYLEKW